MMQAVGDEFQEFSFIDQDVIYFQSVKLKRNSDAFKAWLNPPATIYLDFHFFNITNSIDVVQKNSKPIVQEIGPYVYRCLFISKLAE